MSAAAIRHLDASGQPYLALTSADGASAQIYLHGAQVTGWKPAGVGERLFLSERAVIAPGKAIRGGIPVCFPQFEALGTLPRHGFARTRAWAYLGAMWDGDDALARFELKDDAETRAIWPHAFHCTLSVRIGGAALEVTLAVENPGAEPFAFTGALHTYFRVSSLAEASIAGLGTASYVQRGEDSLKRQDEPELTVADVTDRIYHGAPDCVTLRDASSQVQICKHGWLDIVVWNPWLDGESLTDLHAGGYREFICIEAASISSPVIVNPGDVWSGSQRSTHSSVTSSIR